MATNRFKIQKSLSAVILISGLLLGNSAAAQNGVASTSLHNGIYIGNSSTLTDVAETIYIGPGVYTIDGIWNIHSKNVWIHPTAQIAGDGQIVFLNPSDNAYYPEMAGTTTIDGNYNELSGNRISAQIAHRNPNNIVLGDIADPGYNITNPGASLAVEKFAFEADNGDMILNGNNFDVSGNSANALTGYSKDRMIVTGNSIAGHFIRSNTNNGTELTFPVGISEGDYTPLYTKGEASSYFVSVVSYSSDDAPDIGGPEKGMDRAWHFGIQGDAPATLSLQHNPGTNGSTYIDDLAFISHYLGSGQWANDQAYSTYISAGLLESELLMYIDRDWNIPVEYLWLTKTSEAVSPLPITLISFDAYKKGGVSDLIWASGSEQNNRGFEIERSLDGQDWVRVGFVESLSDGGNSNRRLDYSFTDNTPANGDNLYRLKQLDFDGKYEYSPIRSVWFDNTNNIRIYPNPAKESVNIAGLKGNEDIAVYDVTGRLVYQIKADNIVMNIPLATLSDGTYYISIFSKDSIILSHKMIKNS